MKKSIFISAALLLGFTSQAQWVADSVSVGNRAEKHVFYSFATGAKTEALANSWHLAFSVQSSQFPNNTLQGTTIRTNNGKRVRVFVAPDSIGVAEFNTLDTTGMMSTWTELSDSDSSWDVGAFNTGLDLTLPPHMGGPDYGWGAYNSTSKNVESKGRIYVIFQDTTVGFGPGAVTSKKFAKKLYIDALVWDTAFVFNHANLDNSDMQNVEISKNQYADRFFVYYNLVNNTTQNFEPAKASWDVVFTDYYTLAESPGFGPPQLMTVTGTLSKKGTEIWRIEDVDRDSIEFQVYTLTENYSKDIRTIGYDWKTHLGMGVYESNDSLAFFVKPTIGTDNYLVRFNEFSGVSSGKMTFDVMTFIEHGGSVRTTSFSNITLYPNPVNDKLSIDLDEVAILEVIDMQGKVLLQTSVETGLNGIDFSSFNQGIYIVRISNQNKVYTQRIIKN